MLGRNPSLAFRVVVMARVRNGINTFKRVHAPYSQEHAQLLERRRTLPIWQHRDDFLRSFYSNQTLVVVSGTGSDKTTQISQLAAEAEDLRGRKVIVTQPRRLSAKECCTRVAAEMDVDVGDEVGYRMRGDNKFHQEHTKLTFMTEGILVNLLSSRQLDDVGCVIVDEAHERSQNTDIILALLKVMCLGDPNFQVRSLTG
jgi:HrpA-like RNA helicase